MENRMVQANRVAVAVLLMLAAFVAQAASGNEATKRMFKAIEDGDATAVKKALSDGADSGASQDHRTALALAALENEPKIAKALIKAGADVDAHSETGQPPIVAAARSGSVAVTQALLGAGAKVDERDQLGRSALMVAAMESNPGVVSILLDNGADVTARDRFRSSVPSYAGMAEGHAQTQILAMIGRNME